MVTTVDPRRDTAQRAQGVSVTALSHLFAGGRALSDPDERGARGGGGRARSRPSPPPPSWLRGVMNLRGTIIAVVDLAHFLGLVTDQALGPRPWFVPPAATGARAMTNC